MKSKASSRHGRLPQSRVKYIEPAVAWWYVFVAGPLAGLCTHSGYATVSPSDQRNHLQHDEACEYVAGKTGVSIVR